MQIVVDWLFGGSGCGTACVFDFGMVAGYLIFSTIARLLHLDKADGVQNLHHSLYRDTYPVSTPPSPKN